MSINGNRTLGNIPDRSYVLLLAKSYILGNDVYFLPTYDIINSRMTWVSASPSNLPSFAESHVKWFVFKSISSSNGIFTFESYLTSSLEPTDDPSLDEFPVKQVLDLSQTNVSGNKETILTSLPETEAKLDLSLVDKVSLNNDTLWSGVWYITTPQAGITAAKIKGNSDWAIFDDLSNLEVYPAAQLSFIACGNVQQLRTNQCQTLQFFQSLKFIDAWLTGDQEYTLKNCDKTTNDRAMNCLYSNSIMQYDGNKTQCNGFRGFYYGDTCKGFEYADTCKSGQCVYDNNGNLNCGETSSFNIVAIIIPVIIVIAIILFALMFLIRRN